MDGSLSAVEHGHKPIAGRRDLAAPKSVEHGPYRLVVPGQQVAPPAVAELEDTGGGLHDVGYQSVATTRSKPPPSVRANAVLGCQSIVIHGSSPTTQESWPGGTS